MRICVTILSLFNIYGTQEVLINLLAWVLLVCLLFKYRGDVEKCTGGLEATPANVYNFPDWGARGIQWATWHSTAVQSEKI